MALSERETVVVDGTDRSTSSWLIPLVVIVLLVLAFFYFGGFSMFNGGNSTTSEPDTINVEAPDNVQVQPQSQPANP